uniref:Uncharacterized protein n=1 Tax=Bosea sp. NBC_00436 TaxID=2969620 RepID=A0A9E7ZYC8_9HYPH
MDTVIKGHIIRHSASELFNDGSVRFTGIEMQTEAGESVWLDEVGMGHRTNALFEGAMQDGDSVTVWLYGSKKGSFMYAISAGKSYSYQPPGRSPFILQSLYFMGMGVLTAIFLIGIPAFFHGLYLFIKGLTITMDFTEDDVRRGVTTRTTTQPPATGVKGFGVMALAEARIKDKTPA